MLKFKRWNSKLVCLVLVVLVLVFALFYIYKYSYSKNVAPNSEATNSQPSKDTGIVDEYKNGDTVTRVFDSNIGDYLQ